MDPPGRGVFVIPRIPFPPVLEGEPNGPVAPGSSPRAEDLATREGPPEDRRK